LKEELKRAEAQDCNTYDSTWNDYESKQPHAQELLKYAKALQCPPLAVRQPLEQCEGKGNMEELEQLAKGSDRLHAQLKAMVEECGGKYECAIRKAYERCVQKVEQDYGGDYSKLLDLERATGLFEQAEDMLQCLQTLMGEDRGQNEHKHSMTTDLLPPVAPLVLRVLRCKDRLNSPLSSGYRDILLNVYDVKSGFVVELQLNFVKIAQIKSQSHRFYELIRVMDIKWAAAKATHTQT